MEEENKKLIRRLFAEAINQGELVVVDELFADQFVDHSTPGQSPGPSGVKGYILQMRRKFPDLHVIIEDLIAAGDKVVVRTTWTSQRASQRASLSRTVVVTTMIQIFRLHDGKIAEEWNESHES